MSDSKSTGGPGLLGLLGIVFVTLKLCGVIDWSWWWVTAPFWFGFAVLGVALVVAGLVLVAAAIFDNISSRRTRAPR